MKIMTQKLFPDSEVFQKDRPTKPTNDQIEAFYKTMAAEIKTEGFSDSDEEEIIEDLKDLYPFRGNGFDLAKKLDGYRVNANYEIDTRFCEWLDDLHYEYSKVNDQNVKAWVAAHNPQPRFKKGTKLIATERLCYSVDKGKEVFVTGMDESTAHYYINEDRNGNGGFVLTYERVESSCQELQEHQRSVATKPDQGTEPPTP